MTRTSRAAESYASPQPAAHVPPPPRVSLVAPIRNEAEHIEACLRSVQSQTYPPGRIECIVVDGSSTDATVPTVERLIAEDARIRLLSNPYQLMPHGLNIGIRAATGKYVGVVSGHSVLPADYVARIVDAIERTGAWSVGGRIVRVATEPMHRAIALATASPIGVGDSAHNYSRKPGWVETAFPGFWRRDVFDRIGLFDPAMLANEDNELSHRIRKAGGRVWYEPAIAVEYVPRLTLRALFRQYRRYAVGKMRVLRKHRGGLHWRHFVPGVWLAALVIGMVVAPFVPGVAVAWLVAIGVYAAVVVGAAIRLRQPGVGWWRIAAAFATLHFAYAVGTWQGIADGRRSSVATEQA